MLNDRMACFLLRGVLLVESRKQSWEVSRFGRSAVVGGFMSLNVG